ncbi:MAG TPA: hypothetical protein VGS02_14410 [Acidobacteriaceae bacterium]|nr:hypothetical protein [Acidobacteriaceae bacterium]
MLPPRNRLSAALIAAVLVMAFPACAHADAAIPMLPVRYPVILVYLLPVILIETLYLQHHLNTNVRRTFLAVTGINIVTTGIGYPLMYFLYVGLDQMLHFPEGLGPAMDRLGWVPMFMTIQVFPDWTGLQRSVWIMLAMFVLLLLPGYMLTGYIKSWLLHGYDLLNFRGNVKSAVWMATRLSYLFLATAGCIVLYLIYTTDLK